MRRFGLLIFGSGLALAGLLLSGSTAFAADAKPEVKALGQGSAYTQLGKLAVMHSGRIKPFDTVAREEVKHLFGRETIKLHNADGDVVETWGPTAAFFGWMVNPEVWDDQAFVLVDYLPLKQAILAGSIRAELKAIAAKETTPEADRAAITKLVEQEQTTSSRITEYLGASKLPETDRVALARLAVKLGEDNRWLAPREIEEAKIMVEGQEIPFIDWEISLERQKAAYDDNPASAKRLTEIERRAIDVGRRLAAYQAFSGEQLRSSGMIGLMPRPSNAKALAFLAPVIKKARDGMKPREFPPIEFDAIKALDTYWEAIPIEQRQDPGKDAAFDEKFAAWLRDNSVWVPLKAFVKAEPQTLVEAGYPEAEVNEFLTAYHKLEQAESSTPGMVSEADASAMLTASRKLGEAVNPTKYASVEMIERETHFNAMNPFWQAPFAYGAALVLLVLSLGFVASRPGETSTLGRGLYKIGMAALLLGIVLEVYGFYLRVRISGWAPVTNMYETVIWVALVSAVLAFVLELIYGRAFAAIAGAGVALLGTITAVNVPLLDPSITSLTPVLRSNFWLAIHVLTIVSSYAAFALAWGLGLIAMGYYLTATYRRTPTYRELTLPLLTALPLLAVGATGVAASYGAFGEQWLLSDPLFYTFAVFAGLGEMMVLAVVLAVAGEAVNRWSFRRRLAVVSANSAHESSRSEAMAHARPHESFVGAANAEEGGVATLTKPTVDEIRSKGGTGWGNLDERGLAMQATARVIKPISNFVYRAMQVGVLLVAAGTILGGVWADYSWGRFWGWDPKEVWALITLLVYLVPLHGRFAGWVNTFGLMISSVVCFLSVVMAWYGVNFVLGVGLHSYGFVDGGSQGMMMLIIAGVMSIPLAAAWRRTLGYSQLIADPTTQV